MTAAIGTLKNKTLDAELECCSLQYTIRQVQAITLHSL